MKHLFLSVFVVLLAWSPLSSTGQGEGDVKPFKVPFETLQTQHIVIMVKINGKGPYRLIFDTGSPLTLISNKTARDSGVLPKDAKPIIPLFQVQQFDVKTLEIGTLKVSGFKTVIMDHPTVALMDELLGPVDGIVGLTFFAKFKLTIDYQAKELTFVPVKFTPPDVTKSMMAMLMSPDKNKKKVLAPAGQWGFSVAKDAKDEEPGVTVKDVFAGGPAAAAGLKTGDRLLTIEGRWTDTVVDCYRAATVVKPGTAAQVKVLRDGKDIQLTVKVAAGV